MCKSRSCQPKPPPPPVCDPQCQLNTKIKNERDQIENDAKTVKQPPPGNPVCASGNPLCPTNPAQPSTIITATDDLTDETATWSQQQYQTVLNTTGSVIHNVSTTGTYNWFNGIPDLRVRRLRQSGRPQIIGVPQGGSAVGAGIGAAGIGGIFVAIQQIIDSILNNGASGSGSNAGSSSADHSGAAAQPPDPDDDHRGGGHEPFDPELDPVKPTIDRDFQFPSAGRNGAGAKNLVIPPNAIARGAAKGRIFLTDGQGRVIADITRDRVKPVVPGRGFLKGAERKVDPTPEQLRWLDELWGE